MPFNPDTIASSPSVALVFTLTGIGLFVTGAVVSGKVVDKLAVSLEGIANSVRLLIGMVEKLLDRVERLLDRVERLLERDRT